VAIRRAMLDSLLAGRRRFFVGQLPFRLGWLNVVLTLIACFCLWQFTIDARNLSLSKGGNTALVSVATLLSVNIEAQLALALGGRRRRWRAFLGLGLLLVTVLLVSYHLKTMSHFDPSVVLDQSDVPLSREVLSVVASAFHGWAVVLGIMAMVGLASWARFSDRVFPEQSGSPWFGALLLVPALVALQLPSYHSRDEVSVLARSLVRGRYVAATNHVASRGAFPLVRDASRPVDTFGKAHPDIFVVLVESFNVNAVGARAASGLEYTPFFNSLIPKSLYVERFYGNSVQTAKGQFATLCSIIPSMRGREFVEYATVHFRCLPRILREAGYHTEFFQAYRDLGYDNTKGFLSRNGFRFVQSVTKHRRPEDKASSWGWGLQDDVFYKRFFEHLDRDFPEVGERKPIFATLAPISNHMRFDGVPVNLRKHYPQAATPQEHFANSVAVADHGLEVFIRELERRKRFQDAIVIITGDHSFPIGEHELYYNEGEAFEEFFRVPLLIYAPGAVAPERVIDLAFSQLDIAPTVLQLSGVRSKTTHFMGTSLLELPRANRPVFLVQPYAGVLLGVVEYPFKYVYRLSTKEARLFNLRLDPTEANNIVADPGNRATAERMHGFLQSHFVANAALENDRVWPHKG
jgi:phosphoglycerol transferase MdoB-like AlkP superfamily enzyme